MKKIVILILAAGLLTSCYDPYRTDYDYTSVAFSTASGSASDPGTLGRTVVMGEGLQLDMGVFLSGVLENKQEQWAEYEIDPSLLNGTNYEMMPDDYYTLSDDSRFVIPAGDHTGRVTIELDSTKFVNDPNATELHYAIPFRLTASSVDTILSQQSTKILTVKYMSQYAGFYEQTGSFTTYDAGGTQINSGLIDNVVEVGTVMLDTLETFGMMNQIGADYHMKFNIGNDNTVTPFEYIPNPEPPLPYGNASQDSVSPNLELTTSYVSPWESLEAVNDGTPPTDSYDTPRYGNWDHFGLEWLQYDFGSSAYKIDSTRIFWGTDDGGLQPPTESYVEYYDPESEAMERYPDDMGLQLHQWNQLVFDPPIVTPQLRIYMRGTGSEATAVVEWEAYGRIFPSTPEQAPIATVQTAGETSTYDPSSFTLNLNYRVDFENGNYSVVQTQLTWRNRIRDGVNEWRR